MKFRRLWPITLLFIFSSCSLEYLATGVEPSRDERSCAGDAPASKHIDVVSLGWHTGIVLSSADVPEELKGLIPEFSELPAVELGWGDAEFYMSSGYSTWKGVKAAFFSSGSAIHAAGFEKDLDAHMSSAAVIRLALTDEGFRRLVAHIGEAILTDESGRAIPLGRSLYGRGRFYAVRGDTSLFYTCNSWTASALVAAGCKISGRRLRASSIMEALRGMPEATDVERQ